MNNKYLLIKHFFDFFFALFLFLIVFCPLIFIAIILKLDSNGPLFYLSKRTGRYGNQIYIYKFRTMIPGSELGASSTSKDDKRITNFGKFLRKYKIDEIPQLINIIKGEMSFVGPRPELKKYTELYNLDQTAVLTLKPGLTDFSSIYYFNLNNLIDNENPDKSFEKKILNNKNKLRIQYLKKISFFVDVKIIFNTIFLIFKEIFK